MSRKNECVKYYSTLKYVLGFKIIYIYISTQIKANSSYCTSIKKRYYGCRDTVQLAGSYHPFLSLNSCNSVL